MNIYLDDDLAKRRLAALLRKAGHNVLVPSDVGNYGISDPSHLAYAARNGRVLMTGNHKHFEELHDLVRATGGTHPGILVVRKDNDPTRDMKDGDIVRAIANLEASGVPISNDLHILNQWR